MTMIGCNLHMRSIREYFLKSFDEVGQWKINIIAHFTFRQNAHAEVNKNVDRYATVWIQRCAVKVQIYQALFFLDQANFMSMFRIQMT